ILLYKCRPTIIDFAYESWKKDKDNYTILPLREEIKFPVNIVNKRSEQEFEPLDIHPYMRFGNIRFTRKEIITIRLLLSHCRVKEISYMQGCSEATENKRIQRIKEKLGCSYTSPSGLFQALKENGITLACLESLVSYP
ncbi:hypothetical protein J0A81_21935, partial [Providencia rettgeri]|nr:hypothetical protein [Providencia rettgeri]MBP1428957.1 hypothetical protein [Providencia rettgeri]